MDGERHPQRRLPIRDGTYAARTCPLRSAGVDADTDGVEILIALQYPNGRTYEGVYTTPHELEAGHEFDLYGRRWRVIGTVRMWPGRPERVLCVALDEAELRSRRSVGAKRRVPASGGP